MAKPKGWVKEPVRHGLAAKGIKTAAKPRAYTDPQVQALMRKKGRTEMVGTILVRHEKGTEFTAVPSGTRMPFGMEKATDWKRVNKKIVIRDSKGAKELTKAISLYILRSREGGGFLEKNGMSTEAAFDKPVFVRGSVADQLAHALHQYKDKLGPDKFTYYEAFHSGGETYYAYLHPDGSFSIRKQTKAGNPPGRGS